MVAGCADTDGDGCGLGVTDAGGVSARRGQVNAKAARDILPHGQCLKKAFEAKVAIRMAAPAVAIMPSTIARLLPRERTFIGTFRPTAVSITEHTSVQIRKSMRSAISHACVKIISLPAPAAI
jgi:hypothetical protein